MVFSSSPTVWVPPDNVPYAPSWVIDYIVDNNRIVRRSTEPLDISWLFKPAFDGQQQAKYLLRRGRGTTNDPFLYWRSPSFGQVGFPISSSDSSLRLENWAQPGETSVTYQVATVANNSNELSEFSAALEVIVGDRYEADISSITTNTETTIGQRPVIDWQAESQSAYHVRAHIGSNLIYDSGVIESTNRKHTLLLPAGNYLDTNVDITLSVINDYGLEYSDRKRYRMDYVSPPRPTASVSIYKNKAEIRNLGISSTLFNRVDILRKFADVHDPEIGLRPSTDYNLPFPDETVVGKDVTASDLIGAKFYDVSMRNSFVYAYKVIGYDDFGRSGGLASRETFNETYWIE